MAFPSSPDNGEQYTIDNVTWEYVSSKGAWELIDYQKLTGVTVEACTSSGTWTKPANADVVFVTCIAGGGGGDCGFYATSPLSPFNVCYGAGAGGGGGGMSYYTYDASVLGSTVSITVGSGGTGGTTTNSVFGAGLNGGTTSFGSGIRASGGTGASHQEYTAAGVGGTGMFFGGNGGTSFSGTGAGSGSTNSGGNGSDSYGGAGGGGGGTTYNTSLPGSVSRGVGGAAMSHSVSQASPTSMAVPAAGGSGGTRNGTILSPESGYTYGGGGGGGANHNNTTFQNGAAGASGIVVVITWYSS